MESFVDPIEPYAPMNPSERVNATDRSKAGKDQKEFARKFRKKSHGEDDPGKQEVHDEPADLLELTEDMTNTDDETPQSDEQDTETPKEPASERRHIDLKA